MTLYSNGTNLVNAQSEDDAEAAYAEDTGQPSPAPFKPEPADTIVAVQLESGRWLRLTAAEWAKRAPRGILCVLAVLLALLAVWFAWGWTEGVETRPTAGDGVSTP